VTSLGAITLEDLLVFRARVLRPDRAVLVLHGDLGLEQAKRLVLLSLGTWTGQEPLPAYAVLPPATPSLPPGTPEALVRIPVPGGGLRIQAAAAQPGDPGPEPAALLGLLVPGDPALGPVRVDLEGRWLMASLEGPDATMIRLRERLDALRQRGFTQAELDRARSAWEAGRGLESLEPDRKLGAALAEAAGQQVQEPRMRALSLAALNDALRRWLDLSNLRFGATGDPEALKALGSDLHPKP
jgi:predicted Zn-dependent peptidase